MNIENMPARYAVGSASVAANGETVTPTDALWSGNVWGDDLFFDPAQPLVPPQRIASVNEDGTLTLAYPWPGDAMEEAPYEIRYIGIIERSTAQTRRVLEQLGEISAYYDVQVDTLADRDAYDARPAGFRVLVSNIGDGRAAIFSKASSADADWSDPAMFSGPISTVEVGDVDRVPFGQGPDVTATPVAGGVELNFELEDAPSLTFPPVTTVAADQDASAVVTPIAGGYSVQLSIPRGPAGDIDGVTPFWQGRITVDASAAAARVGLGLVIGADVQAYDLSDFGTLLLDISTEKTPADIAALTGVSFGKFYRITGGGGGYVTFPSSWGLQTGLIVGVVEGYSNAAVSYTLSWQRVFGRESNKVFERRAVSATEWGPWREMLSDQSNLAALISPWAMQPVGALVPLQSQLSGVSAPPTDQAFRYIKLTASDAYNSGVLISESVSGTAPLVQATAVIDLDDSPLDGQTVRLINTERRFIRAGTAGAVENDQMQQITGNLGAVRGTEGSGVFTLGGSIANSLVASGTSAGSERLFNSANSPGARTGDETRPKNIGVDYYMRVL